MTNYAAMSDEDLFAQCDVEVCRSSGPGGQNVNRRETAVRLRHRPTGLVVNCQRERSQYMNKQLALAELRRRLEVLTRRRIPRIPTRATRASRERKLTAKHLTADKKIQRRKPPLGE